MGQASCHWSWQLFHRYDNKTTGDKSKNGQVGQYQTKSLLTSKGNHQQKPKKPNRPKNKKQTKIPTQYKSGQRNEMDIYPENVKRCLTSLIIREIQVETKMRHHLIFARMAIAEKEKNISLNNLLFYSFQFSTGSPVTKDRLTRKEQTNYLICIFTWTGKLPKEMKTRRNG